MNALEVRGLCKTYPAFTLKDVSFDVPQGAVVGFIGRNGAGKSTTLKSILGLVHPDGGDVRFSVRMCGSMSGNSRSRSAWCWAASTSIPRRRSVPLPT